MKTRKTNAQRQRAFKARMAERGLCQVNVWVPDNPETRAEIRRFAEKLRAEHVPR